MDMDDGLMDVSLGNSSSNANLQEPNLNVLVANMFARSFNCEGINDEGNSDVDISDVGHLLGGARATSYYACLGCGIIMTGTDSDPVSLKEVLDILESILHGWTYISFESTSIAQCITSGQPSSADTSNRRMNEYPMLSKLPNDG